MTPPESEGATADVLCYGADKGESPDPRCSLIAACRTRNYLQEASTIVSLANAIDVSSIPPGVASLQIRRRNGDNVCMRARSHTAG